MSDHSSASQILSRRNLRNQALLVTVSAAALVMSASAIHARSLNGSGGGSAASAPNVASDAAAQAAQQAVATARQTQDSLARAARAVQDMQGVQAAALAAAAARQTSMTAPVTVPNGIGAGGLLPGAPASWNGANAPTQGVDGAGQTQVNIRQTTQQAILNWQSFNVGARTTLTFDQQGNSNWVALNRVSNATAPSQILGNIKADGQVYVINRSGVIFGGNSQVNVGSLIASTADIDDAHFRANGIYSTQTGTNQYPSILTAVAASGSLYYGAAANYNRPSIDTGDLLLAPSANSRLEFLAKGSIYAEGFAVSQSGGAGAAMATPFRPAFTVTDRGVVTLTNVSISANPPSLLPLFAFGPDSTSADWAGITDPARFYAVTGDLVGVSSGRLISFDSSNAARAGQKWYQGGPTRMMAGRDIVSSGTPIGKDESTSNPSSYTSADNLFVNRNGSDVSMVSAGRDILYSSFSVAGPGSLQISAGGNILMADKGRVSSVGPAIAGDNRPGAGIAMQAGIGAKGPDYVALLRYLDPANLVSVGTPLEGSGKVAKTYEKDLTAWLKQRTGFAGTDAEARAVFDALAPEQQQIFLRQVYFAELTAGGREYNDTTSPRYGSYLRGRAAIAALFPTRRLRPATSPCSAPPACRHCLAVTSKCSRQMASWWSASKARHRPRPPVW